MAHLLTQVLFPKTHLENYLETCTAIQFKRRITPRQVHMDRTFSPWHYKDPFVRDCIIELKERANPDVARLTTPVLGGWILHAIEKIHLDQPHMKFFIVPVPQHSSKTAEKGFCHTHVLAENIIRFMRRRAPCEADITIRECVKKISKSKRLHDLTGKKSRFKTIKNTMRAYVTQEDIRAGYFFVVDDVFTTGATFREMRRCLLDSGAFPEQLFFVSIAH